MQNHRSKPKTAFSVLIIALVLAFYLGANSSYFETDRLEWSGLSYLEPAQLDAYLDLGVINVWRLDTKKLGATLAEHPWVQEAEVVWRWPNRILVRVQECTPVAQIVQGSGWLLLDPDGQLLPLIQNKVFPTLPVVTNLDLDSQEERIATARLMNQIPLSLQATLSEWNVRTASFITNTGVEILVGQAKDLEEQFIILEKILADLSLSDKKATKVDLRVAKNPVVTIP